MDNKGMNTLEDIAFAEQYLDFVARRGASQESRARATIILTTIKVLDLKIPGWRTELLEQLHRSGEHRTIEKLFPLPPIEEGSMFNNFLKLVVGGNKE